MTRPTAIKFRRPGDTIPGYRCAATILAVSGLAGRQLAPLIGASDGTYRNYRTDLLEIGRLVANINDEAIDPRDGTNKNEA
jgi:hypothetical protein